jgi:hypothetical protein
VTEVESIELRITEEHDNTQRYDLGLGAWEGTLEVVADGTVVNSEVFWNADEFALDLKSWHWEKARERYPGVDKLYVSMIVNRARNEDR